VVLEQQATTMNSSTTAEMMIAQGIQ